MKLAGSKPSATALQWILSTFTDITVLNLLCVDKLSFLLLLPPSFSWVSFYKKLKLCWLVFETLFTWFQNNSINNLDNANRQGCNNVCLQYDAYLDRSATIRRTIRYIITYTTDKWNNFTKLWFQLSFAHLYQHGKHFCQVKLSLVFACGHTTLRGWIGSWIDGFGLKKCPDCRFFRYTEGIPIADHELAENFVPDSRLFMSESSDCGY